jgi:hypothetical protein
MRNVSPPCSDVVAQAILQHCKPLELEGKANAATEGATLAPVTAFLVLNDEGVERFGRNLADFYMKMGFLQKVKKAFSCHESLCKWVGFEGQLYG